MLDDMALPSWVVSLGLGVILGLLSALAYRFILLVEESRQPRWKSRIFRLTFAIASGGAAVFASFDSGILDGAHAYMFGMVTMATGHFFIQYLSGPIQDA